MPLISTLYKCLKIFTNVQIYIFIRINVVEEIPVLSPSLSPSLPLSHISCFISVSHLSLSANSFLEIASLRYVHLLPNIYHREKNKSLF